MCTRGHGTASGCVCAISMSVGLMEDCTVTAVHWSRSRTQHFRIATMHTLAVACCADTRSAGGAPCDSASGSVDRFTLTHRCNHTKQPSLLLSSHTARTAQSRAAASGVDVAIVRATCCAPCDDVDRIHAQSLSFLPPRHLLYPLPPLDIDNTALAYSPPQPSQSHASSLLDSLSTPSVCSAPPRATASGSSPADTPLLVSSHLSTLSQQPALSLHSLTPQPCPPLHTDPLARLSRLRPQCQSSGLAPRLQACPLSPPGSAPLTSRRTD